MPNRADIAVVGGGILGLAHAYVLAKRGKRVVLFERHERAQGASVRNFGMIWPIGQPAGELHSLALRSREMWVEALESAKLPYLPTGSLHVAHHKDQAEVLKEFASAGPKHGYACQWLTPEETLLRSGAINPANLQGALWSAGELTVDPRLIVSKLPVFLEELGVRVRFGSLVREIDLPAVRTTTETWEVDQAIVCGGDDFQTLYPEVFPNSGLIRCKLQMMRTGPQPDGWQMGPALAAGLTLRFYKAFRICESLAALRKRVASEKPEYERWAIHVLASQTADGAITLGDSHEYGSCVDVFDKPEVNELILKEAKIFLRLPSWTVEQTWHGVYSLHPDQPIFEAMPVPGASILTAPGGSGMTLSFGLAERTADRLGL